jgi:hypothetical protein
VEEVGEVQVKGVQVLNTRKNRFLNKEYGIERLDSLTPQRRHKAADNVIDLDEARAKKPHLTRENDTVGPVV